MITLRRAFDLDGRADVIRVRIFSDVHLGPKATDELTLALMRWLVRLACPPGGVVLDPFMGSGSTGCAAVAEGMGFVGIEAEAEYLEIARARIAHAVGPVFAEAT